MLSRFRRVISRSRIGRNIRNIRNSISSSPTRSPTRAVMKADNKMSAVFRHSSRAAGSRSKIPDRMATTKVTADRIDLDIAGADATVVAFTLEADDRGTRVTVTESPGVLGADGPLAMAEHA